MEAIEEHWGKKLWLASNIGARCGREEADCFPIHKLYFGRSLREYSDWSDILGQKLSIGLELTEDGKELTPTVRDRIIDDLYAKDKASLFMHIFTTTQG